MSKETTTNPVKAAKEKREAKIKLLLSNLVDSQPKKGYSFDELEMFIGDKLTIEEMKEAADMFGRDVRFIFIKREE